MTEKYVQLKGRTIISTINTKGLKVIYTSTVLTIPKSKN